MTSKWRLGPSILLAVFATGIVAPLVFAGKIYFFRDFGFFYYPLKHYWVGRILDGGFPLWAPEMSCGTPVHGTLVHGFLYPPNVLLFFGPALGWGLYFAAHLVLAGLGARRLASKLGAGADAALAGGIAFAGSGYLVAQMNHVPYASAGAWAPLIVSLVLDLRERRRATIPLLAFCLAMPALAGEPFTILLTVVFSGILILAGLAGPRLAALVKTGVAGLVAILLASPSLLPALQQLGESMRAGALEPDPDGFGSLHPIRFATLLAPEVLGRHQHVMELPVPFFSGFVEITPPILTGIHLGALSVVALLLAPIRSSRTARWLVGIIVGATLMALGTHLGLASWLSRHVPGLGYFRYPDKYWLIATLAAAALLPLSIPRLRVIPTVVVSVLCAGGAVALGYATHHVGAGVAGAVAFAGVGAASFVPPAWRVRSFTVVLAVELLVVGVRHGPVTDPANLSPMHPEGLGAALRERRPGRIFDDFSWAVPEQVERVTLLRMKNLQSPGGVPDGFRYSLAYDPTEPLARVSSFFSMPGEIKGADRNRVWHRIMRLSATTHAVTNKPVREDEESSLPPVLQRSPEVRVLEYKGWVRRARLYGDVVYLPDAETGRQRVQDLSFDPFRVLVLEGDAAAVEGGDPRGRVRFIEDGPHLVRLAVESDRPAWLFLADAYASGWVATVDGEPADIEIAMTAFRAVRVPRGDTEVEFRYAPRWLGIAPWTCGLGLLLLVLSAGLGWRRRKGPDDRLPS